MPNVTLTISPDPNVNGNYLVVVNGEHFYNGPPNANVSVRIRGDDEWFDDKLFNVIDPAFPVQLGHDGSFNVSTSVSASALNEDWGEDEIYALASVDGFGDVSSNTIRRKF